MYFITTKRMLEVCFSAHPNIQYRTYIINVIYARVNYTHAIDLTGGKCYFTYINLVGVLSEIIVREFLPCIPVLCG